MPYSQTFPRASLQLLRDHFARPNLHDKHDAAQAAWEVLGFCLWQHSSQRHKGGLLEPVPENLHGLVSTQAKQPATEDDAREPMDFADDEPTKSGPAPVTQKDPASSVTGNASEAAAPTQKDPAGPYRPLVSEFDKILAQPDVDPRNPRTPQQAAGFALPPWLAALLAQLIVKVLS